MKITKHLEISTGHRLHLHKGGCSNLHGHNYQIQIEITFNTSNLYIDGVGFEIDFSEIKNLINENFDHKFLIYEEDPFVQTFDFPGVVIVAYPPTAENISKDIATKIFKRFENKNIKSVYIKLYETSTAFVEYSINK